MGQICQDTGLHKASSFTGSMSWHPKSSSRSSRSRVESRPGASNERGLLNVSSPPRRGSVDHVVLGFVQPWLCPCKTLLHRTNEVETVWNQEEKHKKKKKNCEEKRNVIVSKGLAASNRTKNNVTPLVPNASCDSFLQRLLQETVWQHSQ